MNDHTVDKSLCAAFGCPCAGTTTSSTGGTDKWFCGYHAGTDAISWQRITTELNRLSFVVKALQNITRYRGRYEWEKVYREIQNEFRLNQRGDLLRAAEESVSAWYARLDAELESICKGKAMPPLDFLPPVANSGDPGASDSWKKATFAMPEPA